MERVAPEKRELCYCIGRVAWGYVLIHCHIHIGAWDILPDWLGYVMITTALPALAEEEPTLKLLKSLGWIMAGWTFVQWAVKIADADPKLHLISLLISIINMYFHFQLLTDIANISGRYGTPEHRQILRLRTVEVVMFTIIPLQRILAVMPISWRGAEDFMAGFAAGVNAGIVVVMLVVMIWLCKLLFNLKKSLMRRFYIVDGRGEDDMIYDHLSWNRHGWNPEQVSRQEEESLIDEYGIFDPEADDFFDQDNE